MKLLFLLLILGSVCQAVTQKEHRYYASVAATSESTSDYVIPNGKTLALDEFGASPATDCIVEIIWDATGTPDVLLSTASEASQHTFRELAGNGVKVLRVKLINNSAVSKTIGGYTIGGEN